MSQQKGGKFDKGSRSAAFVLYILLMMVILVVLVFYLDLPSLVSLDFPDVTLPDLTFVPLYTIGFVISAVIGGVLSLSLAKVLRAKAFIYFDSKWLTAKSHSDTYTTVEGERLELVSISSYWATTAWNTFWHMAKVLAVSLMFGVLVFIIVMYLSVFQFIALMTATLVVLLVNFISTFPYYLVWEWVREHNKLVIFTTRYFYITVNPDVLALFFGRSAHIDKRITLFEDLRDARTVVDPELLSSSFRTGRIFDYYLGRLATLLGVRSLYLPSSVDNSAELIPHLENADKVLSVIDSLRIKQKELSATRRALKQREIDAVINDPKEGPWSIAAGELAVQELRRRFESVFLRSTPVVTVDLIRVADPGIYDSTGVEIPTVTTESPPTIGHLTSRSSSGPKSGPMEDTLTHQDPDSLS